MKIKHRLQKTFAKRLGIPKVEQAILKQKSVQEMEGVLHPTSNSPSRFEIPLEMLNLFQVRDNIYMRHILPIRRLISIMRNIHLSIDLIQENPSDPKIEASLDFLALLQNFSKSQGVGQIGFTKLSRDIIFQEYGVFYDNAIILTMEMDKETIDKAPS